MITEQWSNKDDRKKNRKNYWKETLFHCNFFHKKFHTD
jgi:hypothetical protein